MSNLELSTLDEKTEFVLKKILLEHDYTARLTKRLKIITNLLKISTMVFAGLTTIVLGLRCDFLVPYSKNIALIFGAIITILSGISNFWNVENFWIRNNTLHLRLNLLRDKLIYKIKKDEIITSEYLDELFSNFQKIREDKINYWSSTLRKIDRRK